MSADEPGMMPEPESVTIDPASIPSEPQEPTTPSVPDKFLQPDGTVNTDALLKSYTELESRLGKGTPSTPDVPTEPQGLEVTKDEPPVTSPKEVLGEDLYTEIAETYAENGGLTEDLYDKLASKGISKEFADTYVEAQQIRLAKYESEVTAEVGGAEAYSEMQSWAAQNLDDAEISMINEAVTSGNVAKARMAVGYLKSKYTASEGSSPNLVEGGAPTTGIGFKNRDEYVYAMQDPRYDKDPVYTRQVQDKLAASTYWKK